MQKRAVGTAKSASDCSVRKEIDTFDSTTGHVVTGVGRSGMLSKL